MYLERKAGLPINRQKSRFVLKSLTSSWREGKGREDVCRFFLPVCASGFVANCRAIVFPGWKGSSARPKRDWVGGLVGWVACQIRSSCVVVAVHIHTMYCYLRSVTYNRSMSTRGHSTVTNLVAIFCMPKLFRLTWHPRPQGIYYSTPPPPRLLLLFSKS